ncbi:DUF998 domain-containing protein [Streptosporangiaceae bacterium NEAU-GS5]|nr:DUF998 domain-containing protein [Streptosporangiaceae bacterium NEAU-GS5]
MAFVAISGGMLLMMILHVMGGLDPLHDMISEYVFTSYGWMLPASLALIAAGSGVVAVRLARSDRLAGVLVASWAVGLLLVAGFPTDAPGLSLSVSGGIHRYAAFAAFVSVPLAGIRVRSLRPLSLACFGTIALLVVPYALQALGVDPGMFPAGLTQRLTVVADLVVLLALAAAGFEVERVRGHFVGVPDVGRPGVRVDLEDGHRMHVVREVQRDLVVAGPVDHLGEIAVWEGQREDLRDLVGADVVDLELGLGRRARDERDPVAVRGQGAR